MHVTIIVDDNMVYVNGVSHKVNCSPLTADKVHAVQWYNDDVFGEVEYKNEIDAERGVITRKANETITDFAPYQQYLDAWLEIENRPKPEPAEMPKLDGPDERGEPRPMSLQEVVADLVREELKKAGVIKDG